MSCDFPDLGDWGGLIPAEIEGVAAERAEGLAWSTMIGLTAGRVTLCPITVRPITATASTTTTTTTAVATDATMVRLERPVGDIVSVTFAGVPFTDFRVEDNALRRLDGGVWPTNADLKLDVGTFEVTYYRGKRPGPAFIWAVGQLAAEFYLSMVDVKGKKCRLPDTVTSVTRQGVSYEIKAGIFSDGLTGIREIDAVVRRYNPNTLQQATLVTSFDSLATKPIRIA